MKITSITRQRGRRKRYNVFVDEEFALGLGEDELVRAGLRVGMDIAPADLDALRNSDEAGRVYNDALRYLSFRPRSTAEMTRYLKSRGADDALIGATIERLTAAQLLNDQEFSRYWIENRTNFSPRGTRALQAELRAKGIAADEIDTALDSETGDEADLAYRAGEKKARTLHGLDEETFRARLYAFLQRRGFNYETCKDVTARLWADVTAAAD